MLTNIWPVTIEIIVQISSRGLSQLEISRITGMSNDAIANVLCCVRETSAPNKGLRGHRLKTTISKEDHALLRARKGNWFPTASRIKVGLVRRNVSVCTIQTRLVATGYRWRHPDRWPKLTPSHKYPSHMSNDVETGLTSLRWRHNDHAGVSNHQPRGCLLNRLFRRKSKKTSKLRVTDLCAGNSPGTGEFPAQMANYAENVSIWWRHHGIVG